MEFRVLVKKKRKARKNGTVREIYQIKLFGTARPVLHDKTDAVPRNSVIFQF